TEEQRGRRLSVRLTFGDYQGDLELLWRQLVAGGGIAGAQACAAGAELGSGARGPRSRAQAIEGLDRGFQVLARLDPSACSPQPLAVHELGAGPLERRGVRGVMGERLVERRGELALAGEQSATARRRRERPRTSDLECVAVEGLYQPLGLCVSPSPDMGLHEVG